MKISRNLWIMKTNQVTMKKMVTIHKVVRKKS